MYTRVIACLIRHYDIWQPGSGLSAIRNKIVSFSEFFCYKHSYTICTR